MTEKFDDLRGSYAGGTAAVLIPGPTLEAYDDARVPAEWVRIASQEAAVKSPLARYVLAAQPEYLDPLAASLPEGAVIVSGTGSADAVARKMPGVPLLVVEMGRRDRPGQLFGAFGVELAAIDLAWVLGCRRAFVFGLDLYREKDRFGFLRCEPRSSEERALMPSDRVPDAMAGHWLDRWKTSRHRVLEEGLVYASGAGRWAGMDLFCVGSPDSLQRVIPKVTWDEFDRMRNAPVEPRQVVQVQPPRQEPPAARAPAPQRAGGPRAPADAYPRPQPQAVTRAPAPAMRDRPAMPMAMGMPPRKSPHDPPVKRHQMIQKRARDPMVIEKELGPAVYGRSLPTATEMGLRPIPEDAGEQDFRQPNIQPYDPGIEALRAAGIEIENDLPQAPPSADIAEAAGMGFGPPDGLPEPPERPYREAQAPPESPAPPPRRRGGRLKQPKAPGMGGPQV